MKIAVPTSQNNTVDAHFGHCECYTLFTIADDNTIANTEVLQSPQGCGCKSNIASTLKEMGVNVMLAGNMGVGAVNVLNRQDIEVYRGCSGDISKLVLKFVNGQVDDSGQTCDHHRVEHKCEVNADK